MQPDFKAFFDNYAAAFNRSLGDHVDVDAIMAAFADCFVGASPAGVNCGQNGAPFRAVLEGGYTFYKDVGTERMSVSKLDITAIDANHHMVVAHWRADYKRRRDGSPVSIDFDVAYMLQTLSGEPSKIFAYVTGDELAALKAHGLLDVGKP